MNERLAIGERPPPGFEEAFQLAKEIELEHGLAIEDGGAGQVGRLVCQWPRRHRPGSAV